MHLFITQNLQTLDEFAVPENTETKEGKRAWKKVDTTHIINEPNIPRGVVILVFVSCFLCVAVCYDDVCCFVVFLFRCLYYMIYWYSISLHKKDLR